MEKSNEKLQLLFMLTWVFAQKMYLCQNDIEKSYTEKKNKHAPSGYSGLQIVHLMQQKTNLIVTTAKTVWKGFVRAQWTKW